MISSIKAAPVIVVTFALNMVPAHAGSCTAGIARLEHVLRNPSTNGLIGPTSRQTIAAQLGHQPTPASVAQAEENAQAALNAKLARAKKLAAQRNWAACARVIRRAELMSTAR
jgi:hypothetical protein